MLDKPAGRDDANLILDVIHEANDGYGNGPLTVRALDEAGFVIVRKGMHQSLRRMVDTFRPFTLKPVGAPGSQARYDQDEQIAAHAEAKAFAYPKGHLRDE